MQGCDWYGSAVNVAARLASEAAAERGAHQCGDPRRRSERRRRTSRPARAHAARRRPTGVGMEARMTTTDQHAKWRARRFGASVRRAGDMALAPRVLRRGLRRLRRQARIPRARRSESNQPRSIGRCSTTSPSTSWTRSPRATASRAASSSPEPIAGGTYGSGGSRSAGCAKAGSSRTGRPSTASSCSRSWAGWRTVLAAPRMLRALRDGRSR